MNNLNFTEQLLKSSKLINSNEYKVDKEFEAKLRKTLYEKYLISKNEEGKIMNKIKSFFTSLPYAPLYALGLLMFVIGGVVLYIGISTTSNANFNSKQLKGYLADASGKVELKKTGTENWILAEVGATLDQGDTIRTDNASRAVIEIDNGDAVRLNSSTQVTLESTLSSNVVILQAYGETYSRVMKSDKNHYIVKSSDIQTLALGTAYSFKMDSDKKAYVYTYESTVQVTYLNKNESVPALTKLEINLESAEDKLSEFTEDDVKQEFAVWNYEKDEEKGYVTNETNKPTITVLSPNDGLSTEAEEVEVRGFANDDTGMKKVVVNGEYYYEMNNDGYGFNPQTGEFRVKVELASGTNTINIKAYDVYWNGSDVKALTVTRTSGTPDPTSTPAPNTDPDFHITYISMPQTGKIYVKWYVANLATPNGFKIVRSTNINPTYPRGSMPNWDYVYDSNSGSREAYMYNVPNGTYHVRVCIYNGEGQCLRYSNDRTITVTTPTPTPVNVTVNSISTQNLTPGSVKVTWGTSASWSGGYKVTWSENPNPEYGVNASQYVSASPATITGLTYGKTYYFRVCVYTGGDPKCVGYSSNSSITIPSPTPTPTTTPEPTVEPTSE